MGILNKTKIRSKANTFNISPGEKFTET